MAANKTKSFKPIVAWMGYDQNVRKFSTSSFLSGSSQTVLAVLFLIIQRWMCIYDFKLIVYNFIFKGCMWSFTKDSHKLKVRVSTFDTLNYCLICLEHLWNWPWQTQTQQFVEDAGGENIDKSINKVSYNVSDPDDLEALHAILCVRGSYLFCFHFSDDQNNLICLGSKLRFNRL